MGVPFGIGLSFSGPAAAAVADGVAGVAERAAADVSDLGGFFLKEMVLAFGGQQGEELAVADVLQVGSAELFVAGSTPFGDVDGRRPFFGMSAA